MGTMDADGTEPRAAVVRVSRERQKEAARKLRHRTFAEVAAEYGVSVSTIRRWAHTHGAPKRWTWHTAEEKAAALALLAHKPLGQVAREVGVCTWTLRLWAKAAGVKPALDGRAVHAAKVKGNYGPKRQQALDLWAQGVRVKSEIARRVGVSRQRVQQYLEGATT